jgi:hypothetical protein
MMLHEELAALRTRIARMQSERDTWQAAGRQAKSIAAYCGVEALELQLERLRQESLRTSDRPGWIDGPRGSTDDTA